MGLPLEVHTNQPARFQAYYSTRDDRSKAGDIVDWSEREFNALPPLVTIIKVADSAPGIATNTLPITLTVSANELGLLQVSCVSADNRVRQSWPLEFDLRPREQDSQSAVWSAAVSSASVHVEPNASADRLEAARNRIQSLFTRSVKQRETLTATRLLKNLEQNLGMPKSEWNAALVRALWPALESCTDLRKQSVDHEKAWLILAGFLLRPGFGVAAGQSFIADMKITQLDADQPNKLAGSIPRGFLAASGSRTVARSSGFGEPINLVKHQ